MNKKLTLAIDISTILNEVNPDEEGMVKDSTIHYLKKLHQDGHYIIVTSGLDFSGNMMVISLLKEHNIHYDVFNSNKPNFIEFYKYNPGKIMADIYIDANSLTHVPIEWRDIYEIITSKWQQ